jgi:hypothetical protein
MKHSLTTTLQFANKNISTKVTAMGVRAHMDPASLLYLDAL